jgi:hypothetical protein
MQGPWASMSTTSPVEALPLALPFLFSSSCQRAKLSSHFFGVLEGRPTMAQSEGLVVVCRLEVPQRFEDLHSPMNKGIMHMPKTTIRKE